MPVAVPPALAAADDDLVAGGAADRVVEPLPLVPPVAGAALAMVFSMSASFWAAARASLWAVRQLAGELGWAVAWAPL